MSPNIQQNGYFALAVNALVLAFFCSCSAPRLIDLGGNRESFDSSELILKRQDRLAYVSLLSFQTTTHTAGQMSNKWDVKSHGFKSPTQTVSTYAWEGAYVLAGPKQELQVSYVSSLGDVIIGDYALDMLGWLRDHPKNETHQGLRVTGVIRTENDSSAFLYFTGESGLSTLSDGYLVYRQDTMVFHPIYKEVRKNLSVKRVSYGYGMYLRDSLVAAVDFDKKPNFVFLRKGLPGQLPQMVTGFLSIAAGNHKIVPRRSTVLKRLY